MYSLKLENGESSARKLSFFDSALKLCQLSVLAHLVAQGHFVTEQVFSGSFVQIDPVGNTGFNCLSIKIFTVLIPPVILLALIEFLIKLSCFLIFFIISMALDFLYVSFQVSNNVSKISKLFLLLSTTVGNRVVLSEKTSFVYA